MSDEEFFISLRATFAVEAAEHTQAIATGLLALERSSAPAERMDLIEAVFRAAHSLKGAARAVEFGEIEQHCQLMEDTFAEWQKGLAAPTPATLGGMHDTLNAIGAALAAARSGSAASEPAPDRAAEPASRAPAPAPAIVTATPSAPQGERSTPGTETVRISMARLEEQLVDAEEMLGVKLGVRRRSEELAELGEYVAEWRATWSATEGALRTVRQAQAAADADGDGGAPAAELSRLVAFADWNVGYQASLESRVAALARTAAIHERTVSRLVDDLLGNSKQLLLLPVGTLMAPFPKLVHDLLRDQNKEGELVVRGEEVELDKRILEEMKDPLVHLLRNCVDHGIELPAERARLGKPARATINITVSRRDASTVEIVVADDGAGIDVDRVRASAVARGIVTEEEARALDEAALQDLIFESAVSTSPIITKLSGRGLGMAIVRERAERLGGRASVQSRCGEGTRFQIAVPAVVATFRGIAVQVAGRPFIVPTSQVEHVTRVRGADVQTVEGRETVVLGGRTVSFVRLAEVLELHTLERVRDAGSAQEVIVLGAGDQRVAFAVDEVLDEEEVLVKPLGRPLSRVRNVAAATVLGSGQVVPILRVGDLLRSAARAGGAVPRAAAASPAAARRATVLVAEDSITSRMLIKNILESAGYRVRTAVDGMEAFTMLRAEQFDLVVSDAEMPRLNGFDLTARIRADGRLAELPVVLVTALERREDRERGIEVGANAYIVKSSFDQSDLLDAIRRLL